jgi:hypothetical protein
MNAALGVVFWAVAARMFAPEELGVMNAVLGGRFDGDRGRLGRRRRVLRDAARRRCGPGEPVPAWAAGIPRSGIHQPESQQLSA